MAAGCPQSGVNHDEIGGKHPLSTIVQPYSQLLGPDERSFPIDQIETLSSLQTILSPPTPCLDHTALSFPDREHIDGYLTNIDAILAPASSQVRNLGARDHRFGGCAAIVNARPAHCSPLDHRCAFALRCQIDGKRVPALSRTKNDRVIVCDFRHGAPSRGTSGRIQPSVISRFTSERRSESRPRAR